MPVGLDNALQIAKSSLFANQYKINVIGQNIANADNVNYTRKVVVTQTGSPIKEISPGTIGTGVNVKEINRIINKFLEMNIAKNESELGRYEIENRYLNNIEKIFNDLKKSGLSERLDEFWNSWFDLSNNPSEYPERIAVIEKAKNLSDIFQHAYNAMEEQQRTINFDISSLIGEINDLTKKIAKLNNDIYSIEINQNNNANDLRDQRDALVKELSQYLDINYIEQDNKYVIYTANGKTLVNGSFAYSLKAKANERNNNFYDIYWVDSQGNLENITSELKGGKLKGLVEVRDEYIQSYKNQLGKIANALITEVNKIHSQGVGLKAYKEVFGEISVDDPNLPFNFAGLSNSVQEGRLSIIVYDNTGKAVAYKNIAIGDPETQDPTASDSDVNTLTELKDEIDGISHIKAKIINNRLKIIADDGYTFAFADDTSGVLAGLGINTFFKGEKYDLTPSVNIMASEDSGNSDHLYFVGVYSKLELTGHEYEIEYNSGTLTIKDLNKGETLGKDRYKIKTVDGHLTINFDGITLQIDNSNWTGNNKFKIKNLSSISVYNDDIVDNHVYQIDFTQGDNLISVTDLTENETLTDDEFQIYDIDTNGDSNIDYKAIKIKKTGLTITIAKDSYGIIEINPKTTGAKYINTRLDEESIDYLNAGKVHSIEVDDSNASNSSKVHFIEVTDIASLQRKQYTIIADGSGSYQVTDENGESVTISNQGGDFVEFDGIKIHFKANTQNGDMYIVNSNLLDYSSGDNKIALEVGNLRDKKIINNNNSSITEAYSNLLGKIGIDKNHIKNRLDAAKISKEGLMKQRDSISGVSIDEEMTKLIQTQHAYIASAKIITVVDQLTQHLLNAV